MPIHPVRKASQLNVFKCYEDMFVSKQENQEDSKISKGKRRFPGHKKKAIVQSTYNLRKMTILEELVKFKGKESTKPMKKAKRKDKIHRACLGKHNSPIMIFDSPLDVEGDNDMGYGYYLLSLVPYGSFYDDVIMVPPIFL